MLKTLRDYTHAKNSVWGITARNREQNFALNLLMESRLRFRHPARVRPVPARHCWRWQQGLTQVLETKTYTEIIVTRVTVPVGEDIGFSAGYRGRKNVALDGRVRTTTSTS